jgi:hypothetical protein
MTHPELCPLTRLPLRWHSDSALSCERRPRATDKPLIVSHFAAAPKKSGVTPARTPQTKGPGR